MLELRLAHLGQLVPLARSFVQGLEQLSHLELLTPSIEQRLEGSSRARVVGRRGENFAVSRDGLASGTQARLLELGFRLFHGVFGRLLLFELCQRGLGVFNRLGFGGRLLECQFLELCDFGLLGNAAKERLKVPGNGRRKPRVGGRFGSGRILDLGQGLLRIGNRSSRRAGLGLELVRFLRRIVLVH